MIAMRRNGSGRTGVGLVLVAAAYGSLAGCIGDDPALTSSSDAGTDTGAFDASSLDSGSTGSTDSGGSDASADADAGPRCDPTKPFANKRLLENVNSAGTANEGARLTANEKTVYFSRNGGAGGPGAWDVFVATRESTLDPFSVGLPVDGANTAGDDRWPSVTGDGRFMYVTDSAAILVASKPSTSAPFSIFTPLTGISGGDAYVLPDQSALYFTSSRTGGNGGLDVWRSSHQAGGVFQTPQVVSGVNSTSHDAAPVVTTNERTIYFASDRPGGNGGFDIYVSRRPDTLSTFGAPQPVSELETNTEDLPTWVSDDDCVFVWSSKRLPAGGDGERQIYVAERPK